ncbi:MAG: FAD-dependent oxidoreductase [Rickettsiales bacterium]
MSSYKDFLHFIKRGPRYLGDSTGFTWVNPDMEVMRTIKIQFPEIYKFIGGKRTKIKGNHTNNIEVVDSSEISLSSYKAIKVDSICAGGFPAKWMSYFLAKKRKENIFIESEVSHLNATHGSSYQFHVSHAMPMYTDKEFSTFKILFKTLMRLAFSWYDKPCKDNYLIVEIHPSGFFDLDTLKVGVGYLINEIKYKCRSVLNKDTIINQTIPLAVLSGEILDEFGRENGFKYRLDTVRVAFNESETKEFYELAKLLEKYSIYPYKISEKEYHKITGSRIELGKGGSIWRMPGDGIIPHELFIYLSTFLENNKILENGFISKIILKNKECYGIIVKQHEKEILYKTKKLFLSLGAHHSFQLGKNIKYQMNPDTIIPGTGFSSYLLIEGKISVPVDSNNSHFSPIRTIKYKNKKYTMVKASSGATLGHAGFCREHALNCLFYAKEVLFRECEIIPISCRPCSRPINSTNSGVLKEVFKNVFYAHGFGGKGITDAAGFARNHLSQMIV